MKLLFIGTHPSQYTGYSKVVYNLLKNLATFSNIEVINYGFQRHFESPQEYRKLDIENLTIYDAAKYEIPREAGFGIKQIGDFVKISSPDWIIVYNDPFVVNSFVNEILPVKKESTKLGVYIDQVYPYLKTEHINMLNSVDKVFTFSEYWKTTIIDQGLTAECSVVTHGIDPAFKKIDKYEAKQSLGIKTKDFLVLNLNRNQPRKRYDIFMIALAIYFKKNPESNLKVVIGTNSTGAWDINAILEHELKLREVEKVVSDILVYVNNPQQLDDATINNLYNACDIGINTCDGEGFGLCNYEHASLGKPQIIPNIGGFKDFFTKDNSILCEPKSNYYVDSGRDGIGGRAEVIDPEDVAEALEIYYSDETIRQEHGDNCANGLQKCTWDIPAKIMFENLSN
tara:strand:- start:4378 stop:5571 length:1194 start_codon:yes stop_codon:yes gene_type:complete